MTARPRVRRTDPHRPGAIEPRDYRHVLSYSLASSDQGEHVPSIAVNCELDFRVTRRDESGRLVSTNGSHAAGLTCCVIGLRSSGRRWAATGNTGKCSVCGACYVHGDVWEHVPTGELLHVGHDCADKYQMLASRAEWRQTIGLAREASARAAERAAKAERRAAFLAANPGLAEALAVDHRISADLAAKLDRYGALSEAQVGLALKIARELAERAARPAEVNVPAPTGRQTFVGEIVSAKGCDSAYGYSVKMTVKVQADGGCWLAWGTCPEILTRNPSNTDWCELSSLRGRRVEVTATLRTGRDPHFALFSRPRARLVEVAP